MPNYITKETMQQLAENIWYLSKILTEEEFNSELERFLTDEGIVEIRED